MIEMGKKYRTRDGRKVRIYAVDGVEQYPVHGAIASEEYDGSAVWHCKTWTASGKYRVSVAETDSDLIEVPPEVTVRRHVSLFDSGAIVTFGEGEVYAQASKYIGTIDIIHNGKNILKVEVVK